MCTKISAALIARKREAEQRARQQEEQIKRQVCMECDYDNDHLVICAQHDVEAKLQRQNYARRQSVCLYIVPETTPTCVRVGLMKQNLAT